jgi:hypothetical protein
VAEVNHRLRAEKIKLEGELNELRKTVEEKEVKNRLLIVDLEDLQDQKERSSQDKVKRLQKEVDVLKKVHCRHFSSISVTKKW